MSGDFRDGFYGRLAAKNGIERDKYQAQFLAANAEIQRLSETIIGQQAEIKRLNARVKELEHEKESHEYICTKCHLRKSPDIGVQNW